MINKRIVKIDNGPSVICASDDSKHYVDAEIVVNFGFAHNDFVVEGKEYHFPAGLQHLLEHMLLEHGPYGDISRYFSDNFVDNNGYTDNDETSFYIHCYENFEENFIRLFNVINNSNFRLEDVENVKPPIYEEIRKSKDESNRKFFLKRCESVFNSANYPFGVGEIEDVEKFTYDDLMLIYNAFYKPNNEIIYIHGNFDINKIITLIKNLCSKINRKFLDSEVLPLVEKDNVNVKEIEYIDDRDLNIISVNYKINISNKIGKNKIKFVDYLYYYFCGLLNKKGEIYKKLFNEGLSKFSPSLDLIFSVQKDYVIFSIKVVGTEKEKIVNLINDLVCSYSYLEKKDFELLKKNSIIDSAIKLSEVSGMINSIKSNIELCNYYEWETIEDIKNDDYDELKEYVNNVDFSNYSVVVRKNEM